MVSNVFLILQEAMLGVLSVAFLAWAGVVWKASKSLAEKFDKMRQDFHGYTISTEHRITVLEGLISTVEIETQRMGERIAATEEVAGLFAKVEAELAVIGRRIPPTHQDNGNRAPVSTRSALDGTL